MIIIFGVLFVFRDSIYDSFIRRDEPTSFYYDENGLRITDYGWTKGTYVGPQANPLVIAWSAQTYFDQMLDGNSTAGAFLNYSLSWLAENRFTRTVTNDTGSVVVSHWIYNFSIFDMPAGWYSAMANAEILHLMARAFDQYGNSEYLQIINETLNGFEVDKEIGGTRLLIQDVGVWYPEVIVPSALDPNYPERRILNGFLFALEDLYYANQYLNDSRINAAFLKGANSAAQTIHLYESPENWSYYQLEPLKHAIDGYHAIHIELLESLYNKTGYSEFQVYHDRWITFTEPVNESFWGRFALEIQYGLLFMFIAGGLILLVDFLQIQIRSRFRNSS